MSLLLFGELHQVGLDESVDFSVHHTIYIRGLIARAVVFHTAVVKDITSDLTSPLYLFLSCFDLGLSLHALLHGTVIELTLQQQHGLGSVLGLVAGLGILNEDLLFLARVGVFILVAQAHARLHLVDILTTGATGAERIPAHAGRIDIHLDGVVDEWSDEDTGP